MMLVWFGSVPAAGEEMAYVTNPELLDSFLLSNVFVFLTLMSFGPF